MIHNLETEKRVLGSILIDGDISAHVLSKLNEQDFYNAANREIYKAMCTLQSKFIAIDLVTLQNELIIKGVYDHIGGIGYITHLADNIITTVNVDYHIKILKETTTRRQVVKACQTLITKTQNAEYESVSELKDVMMQEAVNLDSPVVEKPTDIKSIVQRSRDAIEQRLQDGTSKLYTRWKKYNEFTGGLHGGELTIIAARPGVGKSAFILQMLRELAQKKVYCHLFSIEMTSEQLGERVMSQLTRINNQKLRYSQQLTDNDWEMLAGLDDDLDFPLYIDDVSTTVQQIRGKCMGYKNKGVLDVIAIDYLQLCKTAQKTQSREQEVSSMSWDFKILSKELNVPVVLLSQLSRESVKADRPQLHHLRESGALEQNADNVIFLHVPKDTDETQNMFDIEVIINKQRNGVTGKFMLEYTRSNFTFWDT